MFGTLRNRDYARLFGAQVIALLGTGLLTVALALLAYDLAEDRAGVVLGTALTIKMLAYVGLSPLATALVARLPRKPVLIAADLIRAAVALMLPFVGEIWQIYVLIFLLQAASATFTPTFQAVIPDILPDEGAYTRALSLSRLAYDLENLISPSLAGLLLLVVSSSGLFLGTVAGFIGSAVLVSLARIPAPEGAAAERGFTARVSRGALIYLRTPRLRGLLALNMAAASVGAFVLVNTVVVVRSGFGGSEGDVALAMASFGGGSMLAALMLPRLLDSRPDRAVMMPAARGLAGLAIAVGLWSLAAGGLGWSGLLAAWALAGAFYSAVLTPSGRLLRRSAHAEDRPAVFAAQFALSHLCWLAAYPLAGLAGDALGLWPTLILLGALALVSVAAAGLLWPAGAPDEIAHEHPDLPPDHPHLREHGRGPHSHVYVIDDDHRVWPSRG